MKPRVLFVDDDPMILASLRRQILMKLPDVELVFCDSAPLALDRLSGSLPAVVFSDVRMPEMDGPAFLEQIAEHYPRAARFALTGQSEADQLERTFRFSHQVLSKPMDSAKLVSLIKTALLFQSSIGGAPIESHLVEILEGQGSFSNLTEIFALIQRDDVSLDSIAGKLEQDLTLNARLLGVANSAFVSPARPVTTVLGAISLLGLRVVAAIYSGHMMAARLGNDPLLQEEVCRSIDYGTMLTMRLQGAIHKVSLPHELHDQAFMAATYYSFGRIQFASFAGKEYLELRRALRDDFVEIERQEQERFGLTQELAGAYKLFLWGLDEDACLAIANMTGSSNSTKIREALDVALNDFTP